MSLDTRTADQNKKLKTLNDQIAEESKKTVLQSSVPKIAGNSFGEYLEDGV